MLNVHTDLQPIQKSASIRKMVQWSFIDLQESVEASALLGEQLSLQSASNWDEDTVLNPNQIFCEMQSWRTTNPQKGHHCVGTSVTRVWALRAKNLKLCSVIMQWKFWASAEVLVDRYDWVHRVQRVLMQPVSTKVATLSYHEMKAGLRMEPRGSNLSHVGLLT